MKTLVFGKNGQVAGALARSLADRAEVLFCGSDVVDFRDNDQIVKAIRDFKPSHIVNASAYTAVDLAEDQPDLCQQLNATAVGIIASEAKKIGATLVHYSTDYVFDGTKSSPYREDDKTNPLSVYGKSKLAGEEFIQQSGCAYVTLRVSWVYGNSGKNFYLTMRKLFAEKESLNIVNDQIGAPTWSRHIADATARILADKDLKNKSGLYHLSPQGETSWFGFAEEILSQIKAQGTLDLTIQNIQGIPSSEYKTRAQRPLNSRMNAEKIKKVFGIALPSWQHSLGLVVAESN